MTMRKPAMVLGLFAGVALATGVFISAAGRHDQRFDDADAALNKAEVLVGAADCATTGKAQRDCERHANKALNDIQSARVELAAAMAAADGGNR